MRGRLKPPRSWLAALAGGAMLAGFAAGALADTPAAASVSAATHPPSAASSAAAAAAEAEALASAGAPELALKLIDASQPAASQSPGAWGAWERTRLAILAGAGDYTTLFSRIASLPKSASGDLQEYALSTGARAALADNNAARARRYLRRLIWRSPYPSSSALSDYRRLVVRSYVVGGDLADAAQALAFLRRNGDAGDWRTREVAAEVALERGSPRRAVQLLSGLKQPRLRPLMLLAELKAGIDSPARVVALTKRLAAAAEKRGKHQLAGRFEIVRSEAGARAKDPETRLMALLEALRLDPVDSGPFRISTATVWHQFVSTGLVLGNQHRLLLGDLNPWLETADSERKAGHPMQSLALLAAAGTRGPDARTRGPALAAFGKNAAALPHGDTLVLRFFSDGSLFPHPAALPGALRYQLIGPAVSAGQIEFASALLTGLSKPPPGVDPGAWQLQRARLFLLGGAAQRGISVLGQLAKNHPHVAPGKLLPAVLDLETLGYNRAALNLLEQMLSARPPPKIARHILYWIGKAYSGLGSPLNAARAYIESATFNNPYAMDQWAKTARYAAASSLTDAGLYGDARRLYEGLLNATADPTEQALIKQRLAAVRTLANRSREKGHGPGS